MQLSLRTELADTFQWKIDFCETGSTLQVTTESGRVVAELGVIPPALLVKLHRQLGEEIAKGARKSLAHTERTATDWGSVLPPPDPTGVF